MSGPLVNPKSIAAGSQLSAKKKEGAGWSEPAPSQSEMGKSYMG